MSLDEILAFLRFSGWDPHLFLDCFPALLEKLPAADWRDQQDRLHAMDQLWNHYFHLGEERDLAFHIGVLLFRLDRPRKALDFFMRSLNDFGHSPMTLYNMALCLTQQRKYSLAWARVKQALAIDRAFEPALQLSKQLKTHRPKLSP